MKSQNNKDRTSLVRSKIDISKIGGLTCFKTQYLTKMIFQTYISLTESWQIKNKVHVEFCSVILTFYNFSFKFAVKLNSMQL